jgi:hypothetical protein
VRSRGEATAVAGVMLMVTLAVIVASFPLGPVARRLPLAVAIPTLLLLAFELGREVRLARERRGAERRGAERRGAEAPPAQCPSAACGGGASAPGIPNVQCGGGASAPRIPRRHSSERVLFGWIGVLLALVVIAGMAAGVPLFLLAYMRVHFRESWRASLLLSGAIALLLAAGLQYLLGVPLHPGVIGGWLEAAR